MTMSKKNECLKQYPQNIQVSIEPMVAYNLCGAHVTIYHAVVMCKIRGEEYELYINFRLGQNGCDEWFLEYNKIESMLHQLCVCLNCHPSTRTLLKSQFPLGNFYLDVYDADDIKDLSCNVCCDTKCPKDDHVKEE